MFYLLERREDDVKYDENRAVVVRARNEMEARALANSVARDEGSIWNDSEKVSCTPVKSDGKSEVVLIDSRAG